MVLKSTILYFTQFIGGIFIRRENQTVNKKGKFFIHAYGKIQRSTKGQHHFSQDILKLS